MIETYTPAELQQLERRGDPASKGWMEVVGQILDPDGSVAQDLGVAGNAWANDGKTYALNTIFRGTARSSHYLGLATNGARADTDVMSTITEPGSGYARVQLVDGTWPAPTDPGDGNRQTAYPEVTFGPAGVVWNVTYVYGTTTAADLLGLFLFYIAQAATVQVGQSLRYTLRQKARN